jgi:hypothetical protein
MARVGAAASFRSSIGFRDGDTANFRLRQPPGIVIRARIGALSLVRSRLCTTRSWWWAAG